MKMIVDTSIHNLIEKYNLKTTSRDIFHLVSVSIKKLFSIDYVNTYLFPIFCLIDFAWSKGVRLPNIAFIVIYYL